MAHDLVTELLQYSSLACFMPIWQLCANLLIPNCLRFNLSYSPLAALELYVKGCNPLVKELMPTGYLPYNHRYLTMKQYKIITKHLGDPYED